MSDTQHILLVLVGPAGAGKTTLAHGLQKTAPGKRAFSVSHTTRPMRTNEADGVDYYFVEVAEFLALRQAGGFVESAAVHGNWYGTSKHEIERLRGLGQDVLFDIDIEGAHNIWRQFPDITRLCWVQPPRWQLTVARLQARGSETPETLHRRLRTARKELQALLASEAPWHVVINGEVQQAIADLEPLLLPRAPPAVDLSNHTQLQDFLRDALADPRTA